MELYINNWRNREIFKTGKIFSGKSKKNRTLSPWKLENSILKNGKKKRTLLPLKLEDSVLKRDKKTNIIFWERHKSLFFFLWNDDMSG